jgi:hypothetical protein
MVTLLMRIQIMTVTDDSLSAQDPRCCESKNERNYIGRTEAILFADFREFEIGGKKCQMKDGMFRNNISKLRKTGEVELAFKSRPSFYTIPTKNSARL